jgi:micrococcal nuclease
LVLAKKRKNTLTMSSRRRHAIIIACFLLAGAAVWLDKGTGGRRLRRAITRKWPRNDTEKYHRKSFKVIYIVDGDTLHIDIADGKYDHTKVRLLGIDTPETEHQKQQAMYYAAEATEFATQLALNKEVTVILDAKSPPRDKYNRLLAHLELKDGRFVNDLLVRNGFAYADLRFDNDRFDTYVALQDEAIRSRNGLWKGIKKNQLPTWLHRERPDILDPPSGR